jgi:hypothetical protein
MSIIVSMSPPQTEPIPSPGTVMMTVVVVVSSETEETSQAGAKGPVSIVGLLWIPTTAALIKTKKSLSGGKKLAGDGVYLRCILPVEHGDGSDSCDVNGGKG